MSFKENCLSAKASKRSPGMEDRPLCEKPINTENAPRNLVESHAKLLAKYVNSGSPPTVQVTL